MQKLLLTLFLIGASSLLQAQTDTVYVGSRKLKPKQVIITKHIPKNFYFEFLGKGILYSVN